MICEISLSWLTRIEICDEACAPNFSANSASWSSSVFPSALSSVIRPRNSTAAEMPSLSRTFSGSTR